LPISVTDNSLPLQASKTSRTQVKTDLNLLSQVLAWFNQFYQPIIPKPVWLECQLALAEGFTNAVRHAHWGKPTETPIEIAVTLQPQTIEIRIWDSGSGFDLESRLRERSKSLMLEGDSGRGLMIMQQTADVFRYEAVAPHRNCLVMIKKFAHSQP
jgi:serine/threonine-protein kinase RsbW